MAPERDAEERRDTGEAPCLLQEETQSAVASERPRTKEAGPGPGSVWFVPLLPQSGVRDGSVGPGGQVGNGPCDASLPELSPQQTDETRKHHAPPTFTRRDR